MEETVWDGSIAGGLALVLSNLALLPAIWLLANRGDVTSGVVLLLTFVASIFYHSCRAGFFCVMRYDLHVITDYLFVFSGIVWIVTSLPFRPLKVVHDAQLHALFYFSLAAPVVFSILAQLPFWLLPFIGIGLPFLVIALYTWFSRKRCLFNKHGGIWWAVASAVSFALAGVFMFFTPDSLYMVGHTLWHVFSMIGAFFLVVARAY